MRDYTREYNLFKLKHPFIKFFSIQDRPDTVDWFDQDTKERAKKNYTPEWKYATKRIEYHVNSDGYRTKEWSDVHWKNSKTNSTYVSTISKRYRCSNDWIQSS